MSINDRKTMSALMIREELRPMLKAIADEGSGMDSGGGMGSADLWFWVGGVEYAINIRPTGSVRAIAEPTGNGQA